MPELDPLPLSRLDRTTTACFELDGHPVATSGFDQIDTLGGARHDYPAITTMTVVPHGCGAQLRWDVAAERWNTWDWCLEADAIRQVG